MGLMFPKVKPGELTRTERKIAKAHRLDADIRACYRQVDERDDYRCRVSGVQVSPSTLDPKDKGIHHHLKRRHYRDLVAETSNVVLISQVVNERIHTKGDLRVSGDADLRDDRGRLCGVQVEELTESGWKTIGWR